MLSKAMIDKMLAMPDDKLLAMLRIVLSGMGMDPGKKMPDQRTIRKIRALLSEITDSDIARISYLAERFKNGG